VCSRFALCNELEAESKVAASELPFITADPDGALWFTEGNGNRIGLISAAMAPQLVTAANFLKDVNASGVLTVADKGITNAMLTRSLPPP
jgi:hypothetical protein